MKTIYKNYKINKTGVSFSVSLVALFRAVGAEGVLTAGAVPAEVLYCLRVGVESPNVSGVVKFKEGHGYVIDGDVLTVTVKGLTAGFNRVHVYNQYGTNLPEMLVVEVVVPDGAEAGVEEIEDELTLPSASSFSPDDEGMEQYVLTIKDGKFHHDDEELDFEAVKGAVEDKSKFVYLKFANAMHLPCFIVDAEGRQSVEFTSAFVIGGQAHIERAIINEQEEVKVDNLKCVAPNEHGGYELGESAIATGEGALAQGYFEQETGEFEVHKLTAVEKQQLHDAWGLNADYVEPNDDLPDSGIFEVYRDEELTELVTIIKSFGYKPAKREWGYEGDIFNADAELSDGTYYYKTMRAASGYYSHAEGSNTTASGYYSHAEGSSTTASGHHSHAEGDNTTASSYSSHAEGSSTTASGDSSHAEGDNTTASGYSSHAEGDDTTASGYSSHAEGSSTTASGYYSHAEGSSTTASGYYSHAEGSNTTASGDYSHAQGMYNDADDFDGESGAFVHGCGTGDDDRKNAFAISEDGSVYVIGLGGYDGTHHAGALSLQEIFGTNNIQASSNTLVNGYNVPSLTPEQVTQAYNAVVSGRPVTITDATGNYHLSVMQADNLSGDLAISIIYLNVMLLTYEISGGAVDIQFKNL